MVVVVVTRGAVLVVVVVEKERGSVLVVVTVACVGAGLVVVTVTVTGSCEMAARAWPGIAWFAMPHEVSAPASATAAMPAARREMNLSMNMSPRR